MNKPTDEYREEPAYLWSEVRAWINAKYGRDIDDWNGRFFSEHVADPPDAEPAFLCFWHWIVDTQEIHNPCFFELALREPVYPNNNLGGYADKPRCRCEKCFQSDAPDTPNGYLEHKAAFVGHVLKLLDQEFPEAQGELRIYVWW